MWNDYPLLTAFRGTAASACLSTQPPSVALIAAVVLALLGGGRGKQQHRYSISIEISNWFFKAFLK